MIAAPDAAIRAALDRCLGAASGRPAVIARLDRRPSPSRTSFPLEELDVFLQDGTAVAMLLKETSRPGLSAEVEGVKPRFLYHPTREIDTYRAVLGPARLGTAACYGAVVDPPGGRFWLFLERVLGRELFQVGEFDAWQDVARWLASLHARFAGRGEELARRAPLLRHRGAYYRMWADRAVRFLVDAGLPAAARRRVSRLAERYDRVVAHLTSLPCTLLHGEFYPSNILVQETPAGRRVCPVDWEMAAVGPGLMDLAALTAGKWTEAQRWALTLAYASALPAGGDPRGLLPALDFCRLQVAVQWLGWSASWTPPREHAQDWLGEALRLADRLLE